MKYCRAGDRQGDAQGNLGAVLWLWRLNEALLNLQGKDDVYDRMLLDYFFSYHQFIHLLCRVAINCEKFTETLVKMSKYQGETDKAFFFSVIAPSPSPLSFILRVFKKNQSLWSFLCLGVIFIHKTVNLFMRECSLTHMTEMFRACPEKSWGNHWEFSLIVHLEFNTGLTKALSGWLAV